MAVLHCERRVCIPREGCSIRSEAELLNAYARRFPCDLHVIFGDRHADAKRLQDLYDLDAEPDDEIIIEADGQGSAEAAACLAEVVEHPPDMDRARLAALGLLDLGPASPPSTTSLSDLPPFAELGALGLVDGDQQATKSLRGLASLSPQETLDVMSLTSGVGEMRATIGPDPSTELVLTLAFLAIIGLLSVL